MERNRGRQLAIAVLLCAAGAGLSIYAVTRPWQGETPGSELAPLAWALALVQLAGGGALLATRGVLRRGLGVLIALAAAGSAVAAISGASGTGAALWPAACTVGAVAGVAAGVLTLRRGHAWPGMSARYERRPEPAPAAGKAEKLENRDAWDALDRGDDPTA